MLSAKRVRVKSQTCSEGYTVHRPPTCIYDAHLVTLLSYDSSRATFLRKQLALFLDCRASLGICTRSRHLQRSKDDKNKLQSCILQSCSWGGPTHWLASACPTPQTGPNTPLFHIIYNVRMWACCGSHPFELLPLLDTGVSCPAPVSWVWVDDNP
jgi:hypothetical protein